MPSNFSVNINGQAFTLDTTDPACAVTPSTTLNDFLRHQTPFHGTRVSCNEGGCGACTVGLTFTDPTTNQSVTRAINSCLAPLLSLNGLSVTTNEGTTTDATHKQVQTTLAEYNGTQCGYCSSGMVMAMWSMLQENATPTQQEIEAMLDGNLCRCTGYRPILEAFKTFGSVPSAGSTCNKEKCCKKLGGRPIEIEDAARTLLAESTGAAPAEAPADAGSVRVVPKLSKFGADAAVPTARWIDVDTEEKLQYWLTHYADQKVMIVVGATSQVLWRVDYDVYLSVKAIPSFGAVVQNASGVTFGAGVTFTELINYLESCTPTVAGGGAHLEQLVAHLHRVASTLIRNRAAVVGNLALTHAHQTNGEAFPSDACIALMGIGAQVTLVAAATGATSTVSMTDFFSTSLSGMYVRSVTIPWAGANETYKSYKIAIRQTLDHAIVNGAMRAAVDPTTHKVTGTPTIAIGGLFPVPTRLTTVETALAGVDVTSASAVQSVMTVFESAVASGLDPTPGREAYRKSVALNYFYKFVLSLQPTLPADLKAATDVWLTRPVTSSSQTFGEPVASEKPVSEAIPKIDGLAQTNGTAQYTGDIPAPFGTQFGALVLTDRANVTVTSVDTTAAAAVPGFVKYIDHTNVPASNMWAGTEELFTTGASPHAGVFVGLVVAESEDIARHCAALIEAGIAYSAPAGPLVLTVQDAKKQTAVATQSISRTATTPPPAATKTVTGTIDIGSQYHFHLENHATLAQLVEGQLVMDIASQSPVIVQNQVCQTLGMPMCDVVVKTRRCGGGYGGKIMTPGKTGAAAAVAAKLTARPFRLDLPFKDSMRCFGARPQYELDYTMGLTADNKIVSVNATVSVAVGSNPNADGEIATCLSNIDNCYYIPNFTATGNTYLSNVPPSQSVRGPGWIQGIGLSELMMNHAAAQAGVAPEAFKAANFYVNGQETPGKTLIRGTEISTLWNKLQPKFTTLQQAVIAFNKDNKFRKRGISMNPTRFGVAWGGPYNALVAIHPDGTINITHGGIEIGQGISTKVAQGCAKVFGLTKTDVQKFIKIQPNTTTVCPSPGNVTGGSITSEECTMAVMRACQKLEERIAPYYTSSESWAEAVAAATGGGADLIATGIGNTARVAPAAASRYNSWGTAVSVVEVDTLTGQFEIKETDLLFDCGISMNPAIDVGQVEGGFMFGVGWFTSEEVKWDPTTGYAEMAGSWRYKPPGAYDVPEVLNVTLLENSNNKVGVLNSKAVGEPPLALAVSVVHALENAINASRTEMGLASMVVTSTPLTVDKVQAACGVTASNLVIPTSS